MSEGGRAIISCVIGNLGGRVQWTKDGLTMGNISIPAISPPPPPPPIIIFATLYRGLLGEWMGWGLAGWAHGWFLGMMVLNTQFEKTLWGGQVILLYMVRYR